MALYEYEVEKHKILKQQMEKEKELRNAKRDIELKKKKEED
jgi:hypothetical protein